MLMAASGIAGCATRHGSSGRCSKRSSTATSSPISRCATNPSTAPTRGTICRSASIFKLLFRGLMRPPLTEPAPPTSTSSARRTGAAGRSARRARRLGRSLVDPPGRCRLVQWLRTRDPRAQQRLLRPRALRLALRRLAAPCRRAARDRSGDAQHARGAPSNLGRDPGSEMGRRGRRLRARWRHFRRNPTPWPAAFRRSFRSICTSRGCPPAPAALLQGLLALLHGTKARSDQLHRG